MSRLFAMQWSAVPAQVVSGHRWITILAAMFMHGSWSHIIGFIFGAGTARLFEDPRRMALNEARTNSMRISDWCYSLKCAGGSQVAD
jgi:membrane associated rhomboid family serine protease